MGDRPPRRLTLEVAALAVAVSVVLVLTLRPGPGPLPADACGWCGTDALSDVLRNLALFAPLGVILLWNGWRPWPALGAAALLTLAIEIGQIMVPGRQPSVFDVLSNTAGAAAGIAVASTAAWWWRPPRGRAALLAVAGLIVAATAWIGTLALLRPSLPHGQWYGQWTAQFGDYAWYGGHLTDVSLAGMSLPSELVGRSEDVRTALLAGAPIVIQGVAGPAPRGVAPIFGLADVTNRFILLIAAHGDDLELGYRTRARDLRLDQARLRVAGALRGVPRGSPLRLSFTLVPGGACVSVNGTESCPRFSGANGWALLADPGGLGSTAAMALDGLWSLLLVLPSCYWMWCAAKGAR